MPPSDSLAPAERARTWAYIAFALLGCACLVHAADAVTTTLDLSWSVQGGYGMFGRPLFFDGPLDVLAVIRWVCVIGASAAFVGWWRSAVAMAHVYGRKGRDLPSPTALVGVWFVPVGNAFLPYLYMRDLAWAVEAADLEEPSVRPREAASYRSHALERHEPTGSAGHGLLVAAWWIALLFAVFFALLEGRAARGGGTWAFGGAPGYHVACDVMSLVTAVVTALVVSTITDAAEQRFRRTRVSIEASRASPTGSGAQPPS